jgi:arsenate reductase (thioredoxin)
MAETKSRVLFLCTHNAARSQMAEALLRHYAGDRFEVLSAGLAPTEVHPLTRRVLTEIGLDPRGLRAKGLDAFLGKVSVQYAIIVCNQAQETCPRVYPFALQTLYWPFRDPTQAEGSKEQCLQTFREVRDQIDARLRAWLTQLHGEETEEAEW